MNTSLPLHYLCPHCQSPLKPTNKQLVCSNRHSFDIAKEGYVNLLPANQKGSKDPGDNSEMITARRHFLDKGYYQPMMNALNNLTSKEGVLVDLGCGEGFYTHQFKTDTNSVYGVDISKAAIKRSAKRYSNCHFCVASLNRLPFAVQSVDTLVSIYAPIFEDSFQRVLKPGGVLIVVSPGPNHLIELKSLIYDNPKEHEPSKHVFEPMTLLSEQALTYTMTLENKKDRLALAQMTPFAFKTKSSALETLENMDSFECRADFVIRKFEMAQ